MPVESLRVPVIEISSLFSAEVNNEAKAKTIKAIGEACRDWGFFYVVGHNVSSDAVTKLKEQAFKFFRKPMDFKRQILRNKENFRGYYNQELTKQRKDWKEVFDFGSDIIRNDMGFKLDGGNLWPEGMPEFRTSMMEYFQGVYDLSEVLIKAVFASLNVKDIDMGIRGSYETSVCRLNMYPLCPDPQKHLGVGPHTDPGSLTVLLQDDQVSALQVERNGKYYDIPPVKDSFVINIGDMAQVWSNDLYKAPVHRVLANRDEQRFSCAMFRTLSYDTVLKPMKECISKENPQKYKEFTWGQFFKERADGNYADYGEEIQISKYKIDY